MHLVHVLVDCFDQIQVYGGGNIVVIQRRGKGIGIVSGLRKELQLLILGIQKAGCGIFEGRKAAVQAFIGTFAQLTVRAALAGDKGALTDGMLFPLAVYRVREGQIRVSKHAIYIVRCLGQFAGSCQQFFLRRAEDMLLAAAHIGQIPAVTLQRRILPIKRIQLFIGNCHDLRCFKAERCAEPHHDAHKPAHHSLIGRISGIHIGFTHAVIAQQLRLGVNLFHIGQVVVKHFAAVSQMAGKICQHFFGQLPVRLTAVPKVRRWQTYPPLPKYPPREFQNAFRSHWFAP